MKGTHGRHVHSGHAAARCPGCGYNFERIVAPAEVCNSCLAAGKIPSKQ